ncbi:membrane protein insertase YidC [Corynebacterium freneyi]|uniref:Membrane protein insertase YidC n=1 Tax=Corynebacterium freneyi TaxID=134034 RepID=A0ABS4U418_9CORY|nr:membrane protein insertase YidC [Corynebacterium freneyi]MBP2331375.1 YidC/Oxa1 family membrane protein insertase [Corynebacterium freneyi]QXA52137.1 membrane protein insertase YidC [Corynebacterium freneyi]WJZ06500.1 Membrane protein insertase YidC [Corynebacterium freneyi]
MLNFVYWPISVVLWFWHQAFGLFLDPASGISWVLAIMLLVATIRILLIKPMLKQQRSAIKMQKMQPKMAEIKKKYKNDQQAQALEMRKLQKEMGVNPLAGCLPLLVQMPVFLGLFHVLRSFNRTGTGAGSVGQSSMSVDDNWNTPNYFFGVEDVQSFLLARVFNAPLSASVGMDESQYAAFTAPGDPADFTRTDIMIVAIPLMIISAAMIHFNARMSIARTKRRQAAGLQQQQEGMMGQQMDMMNKMMLWFMPIMILATGFLWHIGLLVYMVTYNVWTYFQQKYIFAKIDREEAAEIEAEKEAKRLSQAQLAPKVGVKPVNPKKGGKKAAKKGHLPDSPATKATQTSEAAVDKSGAPSDAKASGAGANSGSESNAQPSKPAPGQKPATGKRKQSRKNRKGKK